MQQQNGGIVTHNTGFKKMLDKLFCAAMNNVL